MVTETFTDRRLRRHAQDRSPFPHGRQRTPNWWTVRRAEGFRFLNIVVNSQGPLMLRQRLKTAYFLHQRQFGQGRLCLRLQSRRDWKIPNWAERTIAHLDQTFEKGAVAIKVWKNIGMVQRDQVPATWS